MRDYIGYASAATLGYIHNGIKGAHSGVKLYKNYSDMVKRKSQSHGGTNKRRHGSSMGKPKRVLRNGKSVKMKREPMKRIHRVGAARKSKSFPKGNSALQISQHNDLSLKRITVHYKGKGRIHKSMGSFYYRETTEAVTLSSQGLQGVGMLKAIMTWFQMEGGTTSNLRNDTTHWSTNPFDLNPYSVPPSNLLYTNTTSQLASNDAYFLNNVNMNIKMLSMTTIPQRVTLYFLESKVASAFTPVQVWSNLVNRERFGQSAPAVAAFVSTGTATVGYNDYRNVGEVPERCKGFKQMYHILKKYEIILQPGDDHYVSTNVLIHRLIYKDWLNQQSSLLTYPKGCLQVMHVIQPGMIGLGPTPIPSTGQPEVSYGIAKVGFLFETEFTFKALPQVKIQTSRDFSAIIESADPTMNIDLINDVDQVTNPQFN